MGSHKGFFTMSMSWFLEGAAAGGNGLLISIDTLPFRIGRDASCELPVASRDISRIHAKIERTGEDGLRVTDLGSTNGTFVNRERIEGYCLLRENDIIHFASAEFKLRMTLVDQSDVLAFDQMHTMIMPEGMTLSERFAPNEAEFDELILGNGLSGAAQPIVDAQTRQVVGYELLGRANHPRLPTSPIELFCLAEAMDREIDLSLAFRDFGVSKIAPRLMGNTLFINAHPKETFSEIFLASLERLRKASPGLSIVVEIHESAVTDIEKLRAFANRLAQLDIRFAYDDFGAGQARLLELADVPAHFVKFDISLIRGLHNASPRKRQLVRDLVQMVLATGSVPLAEGVEDEEEAKICVEMGFQLIQGYLTGKPTPVDSL